MDGFENIVSITQGHKLLSLGRPGHPLISVISNKEVCFPAKFFDAKFVFDFYMITLKSGFNGSLKYGRNSYDFEEGTMIFTAPGQVISSSIIHQHEPKHDGWTLVFHPDLIRRSSLSKRINEYNFFSYGVNEGLHVSESEKNTLTEIISKIKSEYSLNMDQHSQHLMVSNIELLLDYCTRYFDRQFYTRTNLNKDVVVKFEELLNEYFSSSKISEKGIPTVEFCAEALNHSPKYLSNLLKKETGKNTQTHIYYYLIEKAKNRLLNSSSPVSQVAYELGFEYPQHFSKLFKLKSGFSPSEFRNDKTFRGDLHSRN